MRSPSRLVPLLLSSCLFLLAPTLVACASSEPPVAQTPARPAAPEFAVGAHVRVNRQGQWAAATIARIDGPDRYLVHYDGFGPEWVEAVLAERVHADPSAPVAPHDFRVGEKVIVSTQQRPMLADVVQQLGADQWRVHYDGYGPEVSESVGPDRLSRPFTGVTAHSAGEPVSVDVNGQLAPGKIAAAIDATRWIVRFDGYGGQYDQAVGAERLRPLPPAAPIEPLASAAVPTPPPLDKPEKGKKKGKEKEKEKEKAVAVPPPPPVPAGPPQVGDAVLVSQRGAFVPATITSVSATGGLKVKFDAPAGGAAEEDLAADRVSRAAPSPKGTHFAPNQLVFVEWHGLFVPGKVVKEPNKGEYKIRFDGFGPDADEVVITKRLRARP